jgi:hypothetical protein
MPNPSSTPDECVEAIRHSKVKVEEQGRKAVFLNPDKALVKKVIVDGCLIKDAVLKADYIVSKPGFVDVIVELKGKDVPHARDQIVATLPVWRANPPFSPKVAGLIVCSRSPMSSSELQNMKAKLLIRHKLWLEVDESGRKEYEFSTFEQIP